MKQLSDIEKTNNFNVPNNYFDELKDSLITSYVNNNQKVNDSKNISFLKPYLYAAACLAIIVLAYNIILIPNKTDNGTKYANISSSDETYNDDDFTKLCSDDFAFIDFIKEDTISNLIANNIDIDNLDYLDEYISRYNTEYEFLIE